MTKTHEPESRLDDDLDAGSRHDDLYDAVLYNGSYARDPARYSADIQTLLAPRLHDTIRQQQRALDSAVPNRSEADARDHRVQWLAQEQNRIYSLTTRARLRMSWSIRWAVATLTCMLLAVITFNVTILSAHPVSHPDTDLMSPEGLVLTALVAGIMVCGLNTLRHALHRELAQLRFLIQGHRPAPDTPKVQLHSTWTWTWQRQAFRLMGVTWTIPVPRRAYRLIPVTDWDFQYDALTYLRKQHTKN